MNHTPEEAVERVLSKYPQATIISSRQHLGRNSKGFNEVVFRLPCTTNHFDIEGGAVCQRCNKLISRNQLGQEVDPPEDYKFTTYDPDNFNPAKGGNKASDDYW